MGQRKRHHLVARFLLKRFAAKAEGGKSFIWRLSKDAPPKLLSTKDAAVQSNYYGTEEGGLEAALSDVEGRWAAMLRRIDAGEPLEPLAEEIWHMVYLTAYRASPIRSGFRAMGEQFIEHMHHNADAPEIKDGLHAYLDENSEKELMNVLEKFPPEVRQLVWDNRALLKDQVSRDLDGMDVGGFIRGVFDQLKEHESFQNAAKRGHNKGVTKLIEQGAAPVAVKPSEWKLLHDPTGSVVLGDCPVVAVGGPIRAIGAPWKFGKDCRTYYMPISPRAVIVGIRYPEDDLLTIDQLNAASAALSEASIFASADNESSRRWAPRIASQWMPLDEQEMDAIMRSVVTDFGKGHTDGDSE